MTDSNLSHRELQDAAAGYLRRRYNKPNNQPIILTEVALAGSFGRAGRMDVAAVWVTHQYRSQIVHGYEIKVSRADLLRDLHTDKYQKYLTQVDRLFFVFPAELASVDEIPKACGVIVYHHGPVPRFDQARRAEPQARKGDAGLPWRLLYRLHRQLLSLQDGLRNGRLG